MIAESVWPELENRTPSKSNKWGILDVCLTKCDAVDTGYQWKYSYFDGVKIKVISSFDLRKLERRVILKGLSWTITDEDLAHESFLLNDKLLDKHEIVKKYKNRNNSSSGVKYVYRTPDKGSRKGFYWIYVNNHREGQKSYTSNSLLKLKERVESEGFTWTIVNPELYYSLVNEETEVL